MNKRHNGEGSIYERRNKAGEVIGWAAYAWVLKPDGTTARKYIYGAEREAVHAKWIKLQNQAAEGVVSTDSQRIADYSRYWLTEIVKPNLSRGTAINYEGWVNRQIVPGLGAKRYERLTVREAQTWFNRVAQTCQCCHAGKDAKRPPEKQRCCAIGRCCQQFYSRGSLAALRRTFRAMTSCAIVDELLTKNVGALIKLPRARKIGKGRRRKQRWSSDEARRFLESARQDGDRFYAVYVNILVLGLRKGEALGIDESEIDFDAAELDLAWQLQRLGHELVRTETKTEGSEDVIPLPSICLAAARSRLAQKAEERAKAGKTWQESTLLMTTPLGTPVEPRNFNRAWDRRCELAGVPRITPRDARRTCGSLLADLDIHPRVAMQILRHAKFSITMEIYTEVSSESTRAALKRLGEELEGK